MDEVTHLRRPPSPIGRGPGPRRRAFEHPERFAIVAGVLTLAAVLFAVAIVSADTREVRRSLPREIQSVSPRPGSIVAPQDQLSLDLRDDLGVYALDLRYANGDKVTVPVDEIEPTARALGQFTFRPGSGKVISAYQPGVVTVTVTYAEQATPSAPLGSFSWSFVAKA